MQPRPDDSRAGKQREGVFKFERPLGGLVAEDVHADESTGPAAQRTEQHEREFGDTSTGTTRAPLVVTERKERHHVERGEPDKRD